MNDVDPRTLRNAFGRYMTGVTVVTTVDQQGRPLGFTANSFTSVSLDPPLLLVCPGKFLSSYEAFAQCRHFAVSVLAEGQEDVASTFAGYKGDRFAKAPHETGCHGVPFISGAIARFSCETYQIVAAGDHAILIGRVAEFHERDGRGLGYAEGRFFSLGLERRAHDPEARVNRAGAIVQHRDAVLLERTADGYRPPEVAVPDHASLRSTLAAELVNRGLSAELGPVYSVFDSKEPAVHFAYLLATASAVTPSSDLEAVPIDRLHEVPFGSRAVASMMARFATEHRTRTFTLYLGDCERGSIHQQQERV